MSAAPNESASEPDAKRDIGPGLRLRQARETGHHRLSDVAAALHLDAKTIEALEADDFEHLPAPAFVRGYMRSYARFLGLPAGPILEAYDRNDFAPPTLIADISDKPQAHTGDFPVRIGTFVVVGGLVALMWLWWQSQDFHPDIPLGFGGSEEAPVAETGLPVPSESAIELLSAERTPDAAVPVLPAPSVREFDEPAAMEPPLPASAGVPAADEPALIEPQTDVASLAPAPLETPEPTGNEPPPAPAEPDLQGASEAPATEPAAPAVTTTAATPDETLPPTTAQARVRLEFVKESWVEIYDREGQRLHYGLVKPGREIDVSGPPPLDVLLGVPAGVRVFYRGRPFDFSRFISRGIARFNLSDAPEAETPDATAEADASRE